jgi:hypothetical protein
MTVPLAWELHEMPFDFFRYTPHGLERLLHATGFTELDIRPRNDCFRTLAQLLSNIGAMVGSYPDGRDAQRAEAAAMLRAMSAQVASYAGLDARQIFPLGYSVVATRPAAQPAEPRPQEDRATVGLQDARRFVTLCFAADLFADPRVLRGYASHFSSEDDATLVIYAPHVDPQEAGAALVDLVGRLELDGPGSPGRLDRPRQTLARVHHRGGGERIATETGVRLEGQRQIPGHRVEILGGHQLHSTGSRGEPLLGRA